MRSSISCVVSAGKQTLLLYYVHVAGRWRMEYQCQLFIQRRLCLQNLSMWWAVNVAHIPSRPAQLADTAAEELASRVPASVRVMVEKDARTVIRIVNIEKMRMKRTVPICINNMMRLNRSMMASLVHMWRTKTMKLSCKNGIFLNDTTRIQAWYCFTLIDVSRQTETRKHVIAKQLLYVIYNTCKFKIITTALMVCAIVNNDSILRDP